VDETDFTKFLILSNIVSPFYYLSESSTPLFSVLINILMKSFKQFLSEMESPEAAGSQQRNIVPPGSIPPPKMPAPTRLNPDSLPAGHDRPDDQEQLPPNIDWQELDGRIQELLRLYEQLMQLIGTLPWDQFVEYVRRVLGNTVPLGDRSDFDDWFRQYGYDKIHEWFDSRYPNPSIEQWRTFLDRLYEIYGQDLWRIFEREYYPPDDTDDETEEQAPPQGPSERDRERARERWEREHY
jgi:hypothetical protein